MGSDPPRPSGPGGRQVLRLQELPGAFFRTLASPQLLQLHQSAIDAGRLRHEFLVRAGFGDSAVLQHHEVEDGSGYPAGRSDVCDLASLVRRADVYTSKLSSRSA